nr:carbohydrate-binding domain-containing protein [Lachnospiraceae bacterium]
MKAIKGIKRIGVVTLAVAVALSFGGCASKVSTSSSAVSSETINASNAFTERDLSGEYDESEAVYITLDGSDITVDGEGVEIKDSTATITKEGVYVVSGSLEDGQLQVEAGDEDKVQIVLNGVAMTNSSTAPIYVLNADKVFITLASGTKNSLSTTGSFVAIDDNNIDGVIYAKDDITINGSGSLDIDCYEGHGIVSKNDLKVTGGDINISCTEDGMQGDDSVRIADGSICINAGDDGIHSEAEVLIVDGTINVESSVEGIEGEVITVNGGEISICSSDDGFNATSGDTSSSDGTAEESNERDFGGGMMA